MRKSWTITLLRQSIGGFSTSRHTSILIIRPSIKASYASLIRWLEDNAPRSTVSVFGEVDARELAPALAPRQVDVVRYRGKPVGPNPLDDPWRRFAATVKRYDTVVVLCHGDAEARVGYTAYRILAELLFSKRIVLIGPTVAQVWPGGRGLFTYQRARDVAALAGVAAVALFTIVVTVGAIMLQDALMRVRVVR